MNSATGDSTRPLKVGLLGAFGVGNVGNDASLEAMIRIVSGLDPEAEIVCFCPQPEVIRASLGVRAESFRARRPAERSLRKAGRPLGRIGDVGRAFRWAGQIDALIVPGTGILDDFGGERPSGWPLTLALWFGATRLRGGRTALVSVGAGPLERPASRRLARLIGVLADHVSVRDQGSWQFMTDIGVNLPPSAVVPDVAFSLPASDIHSSRNGRPIVAVPVMKYHGWHAEKRSTAFGEQQTGALGEFCCWLLDEGYAVRLVTADAGDQPATDAVASVIRDGRPELAREWLTSGVAGTYGELTHLLHDASAVVATRYHSVIGALACGKPTLSLGYAPKNDDLMAAVGLGDYCQRVDRIDLQLLRQQFTALMTNHEEVKARVTSHVADLHRELANEKLRLQRLLQRADPDPADRRLGDEE